MREFFASMLATLLAAHNVLGCCFHHAHECPGPSVPKADIHVLAYSSNQDPLHNQLHQGCLPIHHQGPDRCLGSKCFFLAPSQNSSVMCMHALHGILSEILPPFTLQLSSVESSEHCGNRDPCCLPLRLHLMNQVLLI